MDFKFESLPDRKLINGSAYLMDFGAMSSQEDAAIAEGKLLSAFGKPTSNRKSYENSLEYIIHATAENGESVILSVYSVGVIHIGAHQSDDFTKEAAYALIQYVNSFAPADYSRTVYYRDFDMKIDIQVENGKVTITKSEIEKKNLIESLREWFLGRRK